MEPFELYFKKKLVKKISPNIWRAKFLIRDIEIRLKFLKTIDIKKFPKIYFEHLCDILRDYCDSILFLEGYKSFSHEASIAYLLKKGFDFASVKKLDLFRYKRNRSKYYGDPISVDDAININHFYLGIKEKLNSFLRDIK